MAQPAIQTAFHAGEWAPALNARVDLAKYHSAAALLENFFVDYRGGASTRAGTKYVIQAYKSNTDVRLIGFQASTTVGYIIEMGDNYMRFHFDGAPIVETGLNITGITKANPGVISVVNTYSIGDWFLISGVNGMTQLNGRYFVVGPGSTGTAINLYDLNGNPVDTSTFGTWTSGGTTSRVYTLNSPYTAAELATVKFTQNVTTMVMCHPDHQVYILTLNTPTNWTLNPAQFGPSIQAPGNLSVTTTLSSGSVNYSYIVTSIDVNGRESGPSAAVALASKQDLRTTAGTNTVTWTAVPGAASYNVYKAQVNYNTAVPLGSQYGYIGNVTGVNLIDSNIGPDFSVTPPVAQNPFQGSGVASVTVTNNGSNYTSVPSVGVGAAPGGGTNASAVAVLQFQSSSGGSLFGPANNVVGDILQATDTTVGVFQVRVDSIINGGQISTFTIIAKGSFYSGTPPTSVSFKNTRTLSDVLTLTGIQWNVGRVDITNPGSGYTSAPAITFSSGTAAGTAVLQPSLAANPAVPQYFQQRLVLAALSTGPQAFYMSQPGAPYNFNIRNPILDSDSVSGSIVSGQLNTIKAMIPMPVGLVTLSDRAAWLINGGGSGEAVTPANVTANAHSYNGASDVPPIVANDHILYVQAKGSIIRDLAYNFYVNIFTGTDISVLSSHLFFGYQILEWAWAEEPFKIVWAIRDDGVMLSLTYMKEQELIGWTHSTTQGNFTSVAQVTEAVDLFGSTNAVYNVVERTLPNGGAPITVKYIERHAERIFPTGLQDAWCVDSGLQYRGAPATTFTGAEHLAGLEVTGLADGVVIEPFIMPASGSFTLGTPASVVTIGLAYTCKLQTLAIDLGEPTIQGKRKKITGVTVRAQETLGIKIGSDEDNLVPMKDFVLGNIGTQTNERVTGLVTGDGRTIIDPKWSEVGDYLIVQDQPIPATILGVIPEIAFGDTPSEKRDR